MGKKKKKGLSLLLLYVRGNISNISTKALTVENKSVIIQNLTQRTKLSTKQRVSMLLATAMLIFYQN